MAIYKLGDIVEIISGRKVLNSNGNILVVGSGGAFGFTNNFSYEKPCFTLPRKGTMEISWYSQPIWNIDTAFIVGDTSKNISKKYLFYVLLDKTKWRDIINGSTRPATRITDWKKLNVDLPCLEEQQKIIDIIEPFENMINKTKSSIQKIKRTINLLPIDKNDSLIQFDSIKTGKLNNNVVTPNGKYNFYSCKSKIQKSNESSFNGKYILLSGNGELYTWWYEGEFDLYQRVYALKTKQNFFTTLFSVEKGMNELRKKSSGSVIKYIKMADIQKIPFYDFTFENELSFLYKSIYSLEKNMDTMKKIKSKLIKLLIK